MPEKFENPESKIERGALVAMLREKDLEDKETMNMIQRWKEQQYELMTKGSESIRDQIDLIMEQGRICEEAGLKDVAIDQFWDALNYAEAEGDEQRVEKIKIEIRRVNSKQEFPPVV